MDPVSSDHFSWERASADLEGFARSLGITPSAEHGWSVPSDSHETQPHLNTEQGSAFHSDAFHPSGQQNPDSFYPNFDGSSGYSQASVPLHSDQPEDSFNPYGQSQSAYPGAPNERAALDEPSTSNRYGHYGETGFFDDPSTIQQYDQIHEIATFDGSSSSYPFGQNYPTASFDQPCSSYPFGQNYPTASFDQPSSSHPFGQNYSTASFDQPSSSHPLDQNSPTTNANEPSASQPFDPYYSTATLEEPSDSHPFGENAAPLYPTRGFSYPIHAQMTETIPGSDFRPYGAQAASDVPSSSRVDEPSAFVQSAHSQYFDQQKSQELLASLEVPFPRVWAPEYGASILSQCLQAFSKAHKESIAKIASLGKTGRYLDKSDMCHILGVEHHNFLYGTVKHYNVIMGRNNIGRIINLDSGDFYTFEKGNNFHFVDIFCEADLKIAHDFGIRDIPLKYVQIIALLYGKRKLSRKAISTMLNMSDDSIRDSIHVCNTFLAENDSPVKIALSKPKSKKDKNCYYRLTTDKSAVIA